MTATEKTVPQRRVEQSAEGGGNGDQSRALTVVSPEKNRGDKVGLGLTSLNNVSISGVQELSPVVWYLVLTSLGQVGRGPECKSLIMEMVGGVDSGLVGLCCKSVSLEGGLLPAGGEGRGPVREAGGEGG